MGEKLQVADGVFTIAAADARVTYTGALFASTSSATSAPASVTVAATIQDIPAVTADPAWDPDAGACRWRAQHHSELHQP
jgi:hypothetical protein